MADSAHCFLGDYAAPLEEAANDLRADFSEEHRKAAFRLVHTVKSCAMMFGRKRTAALAGRTEEMLSEGDRAPAGPVADCIQALLASLTDEEDGDGPDPATPEIRAPGNGVYFIDLPSWVLGRLSGFETNSLLAAIDSGRPIALVPCRYPASRFAAGFSEFRAETERDLDFIAAVPGPSDPGTVSVSVLAAADDETAARAPGRSPVAACRNTGGVFGAMSNRFAEHISELAAAQGKDVSVTLVSNCETLGEAELRNVFEILVHLARNCVAHAVADRGRIDVAVLRSPAGIEMTVSDDGRGIDVEALLGRLRADDSRTTAVPPDPVGLIFEAALSTSPGPGETAGRGYGLNAVRETVGRLNGKISVKTRKDSGTRFDIAIPGEIG